MKPKNDTNAPDTATNATSTSPQPAKRDTDDELGEREMWCPLCGAPMPDLKGGKATICPVCGFKDSCCY